MKVDELCALGVLEGNFVNVCQLTNSFNFVE